MAHNVDHATGFENPTMKKIQFSRFGPASDVLECVDASDPRVLGACEVLIDMIYMPLNPSDIMMTEGVYGGAPPPLPCNMGREGVGRIVEVGAGVSGFNKPKRTPSHPKKSHIVVAKEGDKIKTIRFGEQGAKTAGKPKAGEGDKMRKKRASFKARHAKNIAKGKMSAAYWANRAKW